MRYSKEHKQETHTRIVKKASVRLREKGAHGIGVADLMKEAGLTHGGFYAHFDSREALVIEAFAYAMDRSTERWRKIAEQTPPDKRLATIVESYLTPVHRDDPGHGCAVPTLGAETARKKGEAKLGATPIRVVPALSRDPYSAAVVLEKKADNYDPANKLLPVVMGPGVRRDDRHIHRPLNRARSFSTVS